MRTLFLRPTDPSTEFGDLIYQDYLMKLNFFMASATSCLIHKEIYIIFNNFNKFWNMMLK